MLRLDDYILGQKNDKLVFGSSDDVRGLVLAMVQQCRRTLDLSARHLEPVLYDNAQFIDAVKKLAVRSRHSRIRIIVIQPQAIHSRGHQLLDLARQLSTFIHVRIPGEEHKDFNEAMLIADEVGYIHRQQSDRYEGTANFNDLPFCGGLVRRFDEVWDKGGTDPNFRRLSL